MNEQIYVDAPCIECKGRGWIKDWVLSAITYGLLDLVSSGRATRLKCHECNGAGRVRRLIRTEH